MHKEKERQIIFRHLKITKEIRENLDELLLNARVIHIFLYP